MSNQIDYLLKSTYTIRWPVDSVRLKSRERSDYQVSILEVVGTSTTDDEIIKLEYRWKEKLRTKEMGLNGN